MPAEQVQGHEETGRKPPGPSSGLSHATPKAQTIKGEMNVGTSPKFKNFSVKSTGLSTRRPQVQSPAPIWGLPTVWNSSPMPSIGLPRYQSGPRVYIHTCTHIIGKHPYTNKQNIYKQSFILFKEDFSSNKVHEKGIKRQATGRRCGPVVEGLPSRHKRP